MTNNANCCNDYSLQTANTGITTTTGGNPMLDGTGTMVPIIIGAQNGTIIRSVIIKAQSLGVPGEVFNNFEPGMVRLFIGPAASMLLAPAAPPVRVLYKEVPVPVTPSLPAMPLPIPVLPSFEIKLIGGLKLQKQYILYASTQFTFRFNVFAEGLDWKYPRSLPPVCCNFKQETAITGLGIVADSTIVPIFTADALANGSTVKTITIKALQNTHQGLITLYISPDAGASFYMMQDIYIPETAPSAYTPSFKHVVVMDYYLQAGYIIGASATNPESFGITVEGVNWSYPI